MKEDQVDRIRRESRLARTGADPTEIVGRVFRYSVYLEQQVGAAFASVGLNRPEADLLAALLRSAQRLVPPTQLAATVICSTGTMTNRLDRLERAGLIVRHDDPHDRRGVLIQLTAEGRRTIRAGLAARDRLYDQLVPGLTLSERRQLTGLLRKVLVEVELPPAQLDSTRKRSPRVPGTKREPVPAKIARRKK